MEILGHRLRIWTLPRGVEDPPPVSLRAKLVTLAGLAIAAVILVTVVIPAINGSKGRTATREQRAHAAFVSRERARLIAEQVAHRGRSAAAARLHAAGDDARARAALRAAALTDVGRDARARVAAGKLDGPIRDVSCEYEPRDSGPRVHLACLAITASLVEGTANTTRVGHPFLVSGSVRDGRYAWCKENPPPGEGATGTSVFVQAPTACTR
jgi:hypothetical protein